MSHLSAETLNLYLDGALDTEARAAADAHLAGCAACRGELAALGELFAALEALPPEPLPADLVGPVLAQLALVPLTGGERRRSRGFALLLGLQLALAAALAVWLAPQLVRAVGGLAAPAMPSLRPALDGLGAWMALAGAALGQLPQLGSFGIAPPVALSAWQWAAVLVGVGLIWLVGNALALAGSAERGTDQQEAA